MRKRHFSLLSVVLFCLLCSFSNATSQSPTIHVTHVVAPVNQLTISDIDFLHSTTPKWLFTINITITGASSLWVKMMVEAGFVLSNGEAYPSALTFTTDSFLVNGTRSVSNLDLNNRTIRLPIYEFNSTARRRLEETALPTGQIPAGTYTFIVKVKPASGNTESSTMFDIVL